MEVSTKEILKKVRKIEIKTKKLVDGLLQGSYHSIFKGRGVEFSEVREYEYGDDIRNIDWNVTSRMNSPYVKEFIEERDLSVYIIFDNSGSNEFGKLKSKKEKAIEITATLMFSALKNNDNIGLCIFTNKVELFMKSKKGKRNIFKILRNLLEFQPKEKNTDISNALRFMTKVIKKRSIIFIISDFISEDFSKNLLLLKNKHDVIAININDMVEQDIPDIGYIELEDEETGEHILVNTSDKNFRKRYCDIIQERNQYIKKIFNRLSVDMIKINTNEDFNVPLKKFFKLRQRRAIR